MTWYLNRALATFRAEVNAAYPNRDKTSDGTIGDAAHAGTDSDHNPDRDGTVDAWDMDVDLGVKDAAAAIERMKKKFEAHESSQYWIHDGRIASRDWGWQRRRYYGTNPHDKHVHWNGRDSHQRSTKPWGITEGVDVTRDECKQAVREILTREPIQLVGGPAKRLAAARWRTTLTLPELLGYLMERAVLAEVADLKTLLAAIAADDGNPVKLDQATIDALADELASRLPGQDDAAQPAT